MILQNLKHSITVLADWLYFSRLENLLKDSDTVLDLGCGYDSPITKLSTKKYTVGMDIYKPTIVESKKKKIHSKYIIGNVLDADKKFKPSSFDSVVALDLIEHLTKKDGLSLIKQMEKIAKKNIIILTPNGFTDQDAYDKNPYQVHKSGWTTEEFQKLGFTVRGLRGLKFIRGDYASLKYQPWVVWGIIATISEYILYFSSDYSYHLLAVKKVQG